MDSATKDDFQIPVLDISNPDVELARQLVDGAEKYGFIFIRNHNGEMASSDIDSMFELVRGRCPSSSHVAYAQQFSSSI